jgi:hypothetical protein
LKEGGKKVEEKEGGGEGVLVVYGRNGRSGAVIRIFDERLRSGGHFFRVFLIKENKLFRKGNDINREQKGEWETSGLA